MEDVVNIASFLDSFRGTRVMITGHTGFKGSWLALWLTRLGAIVSGFSDSIPTSPSHFAALQLKLDDYCGDIADSAAVETAFASAAPEIVFHLAAQSIVRRGYVDPLGTYRTNVLGSLNAMVAARRSGARAFVSVTTDKVYRNRESLRPYCEDDDLGGSDPYSASKSCVELMTRSYVESFLRGGPMLVATVRAGNVIGGGDWGDDRLFPDLMRAIAEGRPAAIRNPHSTRPWQHVLDVLSGYLEVGARLFEGDEDIARPWNFGPVDSANISVRQIIHAVQDRLPALEISLEPEVEGRHESGLLELDSSQALSRLSWRPRWESEMLDRTVEWYQAFNNCRLISNQQLDFYEGVAA